LPAIATPFLRRMITACSMSPLASTRAFLQSPNGAPVLSRSSFTIFASIFTVAVLMIHYAFCRTQIRPNKLRPERHSGSGHECRVSFVYQLDDVQQRPDSRAGRLSSRD